MARLTIDNVSIDDVIYVKMLLTNRRWTISPHHRLRHESDLPDAAARIAWDREYETILRIINRLTISP